MQAVLSLQNSDLAKGQLTDGTTTADILANDQISQAVDYKPLVIGYNNGRAVRLSDIAQVTDSVQNVRAAGYLNGKRAVMLIIFRQPGANIIQTVDAIRAQLPYDQGVDSVRHRHHHRPGSHHDHPRLGKRRRAHAGDLHVPGDRRGIHLPAQRPRHVDSRVAMPVSLIGTFAVMYLFGYSIDNLSLMALTIATGFVVDDAIVVMENISRHLSRA